jgi:dephospho-CoA kinase
VGLTGGIGAGKSEVSSLLRERGAVIIDADRVAREVVEPGTPGLAEVVAEFGEDVLLPDGGLDRAKVGSIVFSDPARLAALNAIVHPRVGARMQEMVEAAPAGGIVVYDVPLLVENGLERAYEVVVVVDVPGGAPRRRHPRDRQFGLAGRPQGPGGRPLGGPVPARRPRHPGMMAHSRMAAHSGMMASS